MIRPSRPDALTALIPENYLERGKNELEAQKDSSLCWKNIVRTTRGSRTCIGLKRRLPSQSRLGCGIRGESPRLDRGRGSECDSLNDLELHRDAAGYVRLIAEDIRSLSPAVSSDRQSTPAARPHKSDMNLATPIPRTSDDMF